MVRKLRKRGRHKKAWFLKLYCGLLIEMNRTLRVKLSSMIVCDNLDHTVSPRFTDIRSPLISDSFPCIQPLHLLEIQTASYGHFSWFTSDWLWIEVCQNAVFSKIGNDYDSKKRKTLKSIKSEFCAVLRLASENPTPGTYSVVFSKYPPWETKNSVCLNSNEMNISETARQNSFYTSSHNLHDVYNNVLWIMSETFIKIDLLL